LQEPRRQSQIFHLNGYRTRRNVQLSKVRKRTLLSSTRERTPHENLQNAAAIVAIAALRSTLPTPVLADTYQIFSLGGANGEFLFGIDTSGALVTQRLNTGSGGGFIYSTFVPGGSGSSSTTVPVLDYDDGTPCTPTVAAGVTWVSDVGQTRCNNGHEVYFGTFPTPAGPGTEGRAIFTGPNITDILPIGGTLDQVVMNGSGDFAWVDGAQEMVFEAVDLTTAPVPEPRSLLFLATGSLTLIAVIRRRLG
jgi:hypothetical protein